MVFIFSRSSQTLYRVVRPMPARWAISVLVNSSSGRSARTLSTFICGVFVRMPSRVLVSSVAVNLISLVIYGPGLGILMFPNQHTIVS